MGRPCKCCHRMCTTRLYDSDGNQLWVYDHKAETYACATYVDADDNRFYYVAGQRDSDVTLTGSAGSWTLSAGKTVTGGTFRLALDITTAHGSFYRTSQLAVNCADSDVQTALEALANASGLTITCTGGTLDVADISISITGSTFTPSLTIQTQEVTGPATIRKLDANGKLLKSAGTKMPVKDLVVLGDNVYALTDSSGIYTEPSGDTESGGIGATILARIGPAVGEVSGGTFNLVWRGQGILNSAVFLDATADLDWNCTAADVQTTLESLIPDPGITVSSTGGPLPDVPINFGVSGWTLGDPHYLGVLQGNLTGPVSLYKFDADLNLVSSAHTGANINQLLTADGTSLYVGHSGEGKSMWYGPADRTSSGDVTFRKFDDTLSPDGTVGIRTGNWCAAGAVQPGGDILVAGAGYDNLFKLEVTAPFNFIVDGTSLPTLPANATLAAINANLALAPVAGIGAGGGGPLPTYSVYLGQAALSQLPLTSHPTYATITVAGGATLTLLSAPTDSGAVRLYDSSGAYITTDGVKFGVINIFGPIAWHGMNPAPAGNWVVSSSTDVGIAPEVRQYAGDLSTKDWSVAPPDPDSIGNAVIDGAAFDSTGQLRVSGNGPSGQGYSTLGYDASDPPALLWRKYHGNGAHSGDPGNWNIDANLFGDSIGSVYDQAIDSADNVLVTGTRVSRNKYPS